MLILVLGQGFARYPGKAHHYQQHRGRYQDQRILLLQVRRGKVVDEGTEHIGRKKHIDRQGRKDLGMLGIDELGLCQNIAHQAKDQQQYYLLCNYRHKITSYCTSIGIIAILAEW